MKTRSSHVYQLSFIDDSMRVYRFSYILMTAPYALVILQIHKFWP